MIEPVKISGNAIRMKDIITPQFVDIMSKMEGALSTNGDLLLTPIEIKSIDTTIKMLLQILSENSQLFDILNKAGVLQLDSPVHSKKMH